MSDAASFLLDDPDYVQPTSCYEGRPSVASLHDETWRYHRRYVRDKPEPTVRESPIAASATEYIRAHQLDVFFPGLYSSTGWKNHIKTGALKSYKPPGSRGRVIRLSDVEAFLRGERR